MYVLSDEFPGRVLANTQPDREHSRGCASQDPATSTIVDRGLHVRVPLTFVCIFVLTAKDGRESQCSMISNGSDSGTRHLALVFFDVLLLDDVSLLSFPYSERRAILERTIRVKTGYSMLAERKCVDMTQPDALDVMREAFANLIADHQEGAVLKADSAQYGERRLPWVKVRLTRFGDCFIH